MRPLLLATVPLSLIAETGMFVLIMALLGLPVWWVWARALRDVKRELAHRPGPTDTFEPASAIGRQPTGARF